MTSSSNVAVFLLSSLVTGPSFQVNVITGSGVMTIFLYKGLTGNPEIRSFSQYVETGSSWRYQIWHECLSNDNEVLLQNPRVTAFTFSKLLR